MKTLIGRCKHYLFPVAIGTLLISRYYRKADWSIALLSMAIAVGVILLVNFIAIRKG